jgi:hypothetical protein
MPNVATCLCASIYQGRRRAATSIPAGHARTLGEASATAVSGLLLVFAKPLRSPGCARALQVKHR